MRRELPRAGYILLLLAGIYLVVFFAVAAWQGTKLLSTLPASLVSTSTGTVITMTGTLTGQGAITHVRDGDTVEVRLQGTDVPIRLIGVDTPESVHPTKGVECFGREASAFTKQFLNVQVTLFGDPTQDAYDSYGRQLAYVVLPDGRQLNRVLVEQGIAREYTYRKPYLYQQEFRTLQEAARQSSAGLWAACPQK